MISGGLLYMKMMIIDAVYYKAPRRDAYTRYKKRQDV